MKKTAIILGATGLTGSHVLAQLINDERYGHIKLFSRSKIEKVPTKVSQYIGDLFDLDSFKKDFTGDDVFCCIGTTKSKTPDKETYKQIDYGIPVNAAKLSKTNKINTFVVISSMGANKDSSLFYSKTKGEMESDVLKQDIENTYVLRPSLIGGDRNEKRFSERLAVAFFKVIQPLFFGPLKNYKVIEPETIAKAMIFLANHRGIDKKIIQSQSIKKIVNQK